MLGSWMQPPRKLPSYMMSLVLWTALGDILQAKVMDILDSC